MNFKIARAGLHFWEEPVISGQNGSGTIFFSGCQLHCAYCQNYEISHKAKGLFVSSDQLVKLMLYLQQQGAHNINLVTPSHYITKLPQVLKEAKQRGLKIPIVYNTSSYESVENLQALEGLVDIYLPDLKYSDNALGQKFSRVPDYFYVATKAIKEMRRQQPKDCIQNELMKNGVIVRHLILPGYVENSKRVLDFLADFDKTLLVSLMSQYFPTPKVKDYPELNRRITQSEYDELIHYFFRIGLDNGFCQELSSAIEDYVPDFDLNELKEIIDKL